TVSAIAGSGSVTTLTVGGHPEFIYVNPGSGDTYAYGTDYGTTGPPYVERISVINSAEKVVKNLTVHSITSALANLFGYDPATKNSYFVGLNDTTGKSYLIVISSANAVSATISLGKGAFTFANYDPANGDMYVTSLSNSIVVVSGTTVAKTLKVTQNVTLMIYDPTLKDMVGAGDVNQTTVSTLFFVSSTNAVSSITAGKYAIAAFYDPKDAYVYVVNIGSKNVELVG
ncbi:MAG: hypothetical protein ABSB97_06490, partial [Thermoplasmata archaeon]